ncbi:MAG: nitronate monooxygenase, partial [Ilumatobacteraceae bacterium]
MSRRPIRTRVSDLLGVDYPIVQAPMGWIARSPLASAVSNAGALGIIETSSGDLTDRPFGVNIAQL